MALVQQLGKVMHRHKDDIERLVHRNPQVVHHASTIEGPRSARAGGTSIATRISTSIRIGLMTATSLSTNRMFAPQGNRRPSLASMGK